MRDHIANRLSVRIKILVVLSIINFSLGSSQDTPLSRQMAATVMELWPDSMAVKSGRPAQWNYEQGVVLEGFASLWKNTADPRYFDYIQKSIDFYVTPEGDIRTYRKGEYNIDHVKTGRSLLTLYKVTNDPKYYKAAHLLREQLKSHPRNAEGGFWHKQIYPNQMWLDGLYMAEPFYTEYAETFHEQEAFDDIALQFILMERHARDRKTGLLYHGWDESKQQKWANKTTGCSPNFWGRSMGWYGMALVDVLDHFPVTHPAHDTLVAILQRLAGAVIKVQDPVSGLWYQVPDKQGEKGNYHEASASCMFVYMLSKGIRQGYLPCSYLKAVARAWDGITGEFVEKRGDGTINLKGTVSVAGLGGNPYRDGSYGYYLSERVVTNDPKGIGAFLLAANEVEMIPETVTGMNRTVLLDNYFNHETRRIVTGMEIPYHYLWNQEDQNGYSFFGHVFNKHGVKTFQSDAEPGAALLKKADIYIIVDPDTKKENTDPHFIEARHIKAIEDWVKNGGILLLFANDSSNTELSHFNQLAATFGIHFNDERRNMVKGRAYETGAVRIPSAHFIFPDVKKVYMKEICTLSVTAPAKAALTDGEDIIIAVAKAGKGTVFAVGDPWFYNEYVDGRKISSTEYENYKAAEDLVKWILKQLPMGK